MELAEVEANIRQNVPWDELPASVKQQIGNSKKEYEKAVIVFSIKNQVRFRISLVRHIRKDERKYYDEMIEYSRKSLMLFPYHLSDIIVRVHNITPFSYYISMLEFLMEQEKSYDSLPNFTAADCLRLLGIGRNQYIDLMNSNRSSRKFGFFRKKGNTDLLPTKPVDNLVFQPWWILQVGYVTEDDVKMLSKEEHKALDRLIDLGGGIFAGNFDFSIVKQLYMNGLVYFDVPIDDNDYVIVPPLENFVMNRVLGDFFETLLYKIFVSIDENTTVAELASILEIDSSHIRHAVSLYCRLGIARKKNAELDSNDLHPSWYDHVDSGSSGLNAATFSAAPKAGPARTVSISSEDEDDTLLRELNQALENPDDTDGGEDLPLEKQQQGGSSEFLYVQGTSNSTAVTSGNRKIGFLFDSTLTAYLMMGNLSPGLKTHAVTMFEVGKLSDESLDSLVTELDKVSNTDGEGEAARYFSHAVTLRETVRFLRQNASMTLENDASANKCLGLDLIRCESLQSLDAATASRLLKKNYSLLVSMAPLKNELRPLKGCFPPHLGPSVPEMTSVWFKMFLYHVTGNGPPSLLLPKGSRLRRLPKTFEGCTKLLVTTWGHDPSEIPVSGALPLLLDALQHSPVLVQAYSQQAVTSGVGGGGDPHQTVNLTKTLPFPFQVQGNSQSTDRKWLQKETLSRLSDLIDMEHNCGYITLIRVKSNGMNKDVDNTEEEPTKNGEIIPENADLLAEELEALDVKMDSADSNKLNKKKLHLNLEGLKGNQPEEDNNPKLWAWILLDVNFGIPLFDTILNQEICQRIVSHELWKPESLEKLTESSQALGQKLLDFIGQYQASPLFPGQSKTSKGEVALPSKQIYFDGKELHVTTF